MKKSLLFIFSSIVVISLLLQSCSRSVEGETKSWESNKQMCDQVKSKYPTFANAVSEQLQKAQSAWESAQKIGNEEQKIAALADANKLISGSFVSDLSGMESTMSSLDNKISDLRKTSVDDLNINNRISSVMNEVTNVQSSVNNMLMNGAPNAAQAQAVVQNIKSRIESTLRSISDVASLVSAKTKAAADSLASKKAADEKEKKLTEDWKCKYCSSTNKYTETQCKSCGASKTTTSGVDGMSKDQWKCKYCGSPNNADVSKCGGCGAGK